MRILQVWQEGDTDDDVSSEQLDQLMAEMYLKGLGDSAYPELYGERNLEIGVQSISWVNMKLILVIRRMFAEAEKWTR